MRRKLLLFGAGAFAEIAHYYFREDSPYETTAFVVDGTHLRETNYHGLPVIAWEEAVERFPARDHDFFVALGLHRLNQTRAEKVAMVEANGYRVASFVSSKATVPRDLAIGPNTMIMEHTGIQPYTQVGRNTIIWGMTRVAFRTRIGNHCWLVSAAIGESCTIDDHTFIGLNATIGPHVHVAARNLVGAGAVLTQSTQPDQVFRGMVSRASRVPSYRLRLD